MNNQNNTIETLDSTFLVANLKCNGCASTIRNKISELEGVKDVAVDIENASVKIIHFSNIDPHVFAEKLAKLGYPEIGDDNDLLTQMKSYASCMIGKIS